MKRINIAVVALALMTFATPLAAQIKAHVTPFYGYVLPQGDLPATFALTKNDATSMDIQDGKFESRTAVYGATVGVTVFKGLGVEGTILTGTDELTATRMSPVDTKILAYSGGLSYELPKYWRAQPFVIAGAGVKSYDFDIPDTKTRKNYEYNVGAGVNVEVVKNIAFTVQARDLYSSFSSSLYGVPNETQNDIFVAAGLTVNFGVGAKGGVAAIKR